MADEWVSVRAMLVEDPKTITITESLKKHKPFRDWLGVPPDKLNPDALCSVTVNALIRVWAIANSRGVPEEMDVLLSHANLAWVDRVAKIPGLAKAMEIVHWVAEEQRNGVTFVRLPNFLEYNLPVEIRSEKEAKEREQNRQRQQRFRDKRNGGKRNVTTNNAPTVQHSTAQDSTKQVLAANAQDIDRGCGGKIFGDPPSSFCEVLKDVCMVIPNGGDQMGFLAKLAYADAAGFEFNKPLMDYIGRAKNKGNPCGWITNALKADLGPERWEEFQQSSPTIGECSALVAKLGAEAWE